MCRLKIIKKGILAAIIMLLYAVLGFGQNPQALRHCVTDEYKMDFFILLSDKQKTPKDTLEYYWFRAQKVHHTQGGAAGNLLHGDFAKYYPNGQLAEKGTFKFGLKNGIWFSWYPSGSIKTRAYYKMGVLNGTFYEKNEQGETIKHVKYRKGVAKHPRVKEKKTEKRSLKAIFEWLKKGEDNPENDKDNPEKEKNKKSKEQKDLEKEKKRQEREQCRANRKRQKSEG